MGWVRMDWVRMGWDGMGYDGLEIGESVAVHVAMGVLGVDWAQSCAPGDYGSSGGGCCGSRSSGALGLLAWCVVIL